MNKQTRIEVLKRKLNKIENKLDDLYVSSPWNPDSNWQISMTLWEKDDIVKELKKLKQL